MSEKRERLDLGVESMDREHRGQLEHMSLLEAAIEEGRPAAEIARLTEDLVQYLQAHFLSEQISMRESAYPAYEDHLGEHDEAVLLLEQLEERARAGDLRAGSELLTVLRGLLVEHVHRSDSTLVTYLTRRSD